MQSLREKSSPHVEKKSFALMSGREEYRAPRQSPATL
jgi:hypothetical protein